MKGCKLIAIYRNTLLGSLFFESQKITNIIFFSQFNIFINACNHYEIRSGVKDYYFDRTDKSEHNTSLQFDLYFPLHYIFFPRLNDWYNPSIVYQLIHIQQIISEQYVNYISLARD